MRTRWYTFEWLVGHWRNQGGHLKIPQIKWKWKHYDSHWEKLTQFWKGLTNLILLLVSSFRSAITSTSKLLKYLSCVLSISVNFLALLWNLINTLEIIEISNNLMMNLKVLEKREQCKSKQQQTARNNEDQGRN